MTDLTGISNDTLLAELARKGRALERYERADGPMWGFERQEREQCKAEYNRLVSEWVRRGQPKGE
jgi:hypothetical protein